VEKWDSGHIRGPRLRRSFAALKTEAACRFFEDAKSRFLSLIRNGCIFGDGNF